MSTNPTSIGTESLRLQAPRPSNAVVLALVVALLDLEQRRVRGKVRPQMRTGPAT
jgi:hypothetical protein